MLKLVCVAFLLGFCCVLLYCFFENMEACSSLSVLSVLSVLPFFSLNFENMEACSSSSVSVCLCCAVLVFENMEACSSSSVLVFLLWFAVFLLCWFF